MVWIKPTINGRIIDGRIKKNIPGLSQVFRKK